MSSTTIGCIAAAAHILGDKWTPQLLRFLSNESAVRFCQLQDMAGGINPRTLSARLAHLEREGIIEKCPLQESSRCEYKLTVKGSALIPILHDMETWSHRYAGA